MGKIQSEMTSDFTMVHNAFIKDKRINASEKGVLLVMLQKPAGYRFTIRGLANEMKDGVTSITTSIHNLKKFGYVKDKRVVTNGRFAYNDYDYCDEPIFKTEFNDPESMAGFSTKFAESISSGTPVITNATSNLDEYANGKTNGILLNNISPSIISEVIDSIESKMIVDDSLFDYHNYFEKMKSFLLMY